MNGTIDGNRVLQFESAPAYTGEQNAVILKIDISDWESENPDCYILCFETSPMGEVFITAEKGVEEGRQAYIAEDYLLCPLSAELTSTGLLKLQLTAIFKEDDGSERVEKTSVATLEFEPSIAVGAEYYGNDSTTYGEIEKLKENLESIKEMSQEFSFDYFAAALSGKLLFEGDETTPIYFPESSVKAERLIYGLITEFDSDIMKYAIIVIPSDSVNKARLCIFRMGDNAAIIKYYSGIKLLELLRTGVII